MLEADNADTACTVPPDIGQFYDSARLFYRSGGAKLIDGNEVQVLQDAQQNFPAWLDALENAKEYILIEMYLITVDGLSLRWREILLERIAAGVKVYLAYDWFGCIGAHFKRFFTPLLQAGAQVAVYNKPSWLSGIGLLSRNHRKSIIVDGETAFVSGLCLSAQWQGNAAEGTPPWRDTGLAIRGPAVAEIIAAFNDTWQSITRTLPEELVQRQKNVSPEARGSIALRVVATTPENANMVRLDLISISMAKHTLWITDAYFMPSKMYTRALINASRDGVDVRILVPSTSDIRWIGTVSRTQYRALLDAGVRVFEWNGPMIHAKTSIADGCWARVGSTNLNFSSWFANRELDIVIEDTEGVFPLQRDFLADLGNAVEIVPDEKSAHPSAARRKTSAHRPIARHTQTATRQIAYIGQAVDQILSGNATAAVGKGELWAYSSIAATLAVLAVLIFFFPKIIAVPAIIIFTVGSIAALLHVLRLWRGYREYRKHDENRPSPTL